jgi:glycosyltransferase involved in cell wall biosynthesis
MEDKVHRLEVIDSILTNIKLSTMFSVIIPLYNKAPYIEKAIRSVAAQTYQEFELIIIDDGSIDDPLPPKGGSTALRFSSFGSLSEKINFIEQLNQGVSVTRNRGVELAKYDYIAFLDADDWWEPTYLEEMKGLIEEFPEAGIYGSSYYKVKNGNLIPANIGVEEGFKKGIINYCRVYARTMYMPLTSITSVIKRSVFDSENGFKPQLKLGEDFDLWLRIAMKYPVAFLNKQLAYYNQDVEQINRGVVDDKIYEPATFVIFNMDFLSAFENNNVDLKILLDRLRVYSLLRYQIKGAYKPLVKEVISNVNFKNVDKKYYFYYHIPRFIVASWFNISRIASKLKKRIRK